MKIWHMNKLILRYLFKLYIVLVYSIFLYWQLTTENETLECECVTGLTNSQKETLE